MAANPVIGPVNRSFLLQLLHYAGWQLAVREDDIVRIRASRGGIEVDASGRSFPEAAGTIFARAMRSRRSEAS